MKSTLVLSLECKQYFIYRKCVLLEPPRILRVVSSLTFGPPARGFLGIFAVVGMSLFWRCHFFHNFYRSPFSSWIFCSFSISILLEVTMSYIFHRCFLLLIDHYYTDVLHWCSITITCLSALDLKVPQDLSMRFCHSIMLFPLGGVCILIYLCIPLLLFSFWLHHALCYWALDCLRGISALSCQVIMHTSFVTALIGHFISYTYHVVVLYMSGVA